MGILSVCSATQIVHVLRNVSKHSSGCFMGVGSREGRIQGCLLCQDVSLVHASRHINRSAAMQIGMVGNLCYGYVQDVSHVERVWSHDISLFAQERPTLPCAERLRTTRRCLSYNSDLPSAARTVSDRPNTCALFHRNNKTCEHGFSGGPFKSSLSWLEKDRRKRESLPCLQCLHHVNIIPGDWKFADEANCSWTSRYKVDTLYFSRHREHSYTLPKAKDRLFMFVLWARPLSLKDSDHGS